MPHTVQSCPTYPDPSATTEILFEGTPDEALEYYLHCLGLRGIKESSQAIVLLDEHSRPIYAFS